MQLYQYLHENEITAKQFGEKIGYCPTYIALLARWKHVPSVRLAKLIQKASGGQVDAQELIRKCMEKKLEKGFAKKKN